MLQSDVAKDRLEDQLSDEERQLKNTIGNLPEIAILQLIYQQKA